MKTIIVTRHYNGFVNASDTYQLGNHESDGSAVATVYELPEGYSTQNGFVYDPTGYMCEIAHSDHGGPALYCRYSCDPIILKEAAQ